MKTIISSSPEETRDLGRSLAKEAVAGDVFCLDGDLGAGKTEFAKGFAEGLGIREPITSPTFVIVNEYAGRLPLYHFDIYRIDDPEELFEVGFEDYLFGDGVCLIEWAKRAEELLPDSRIELQFKYMGDAERRIEIRGPENEETDQ